jgi:hypothetical protein
MKRLYFILMCIALSLPQGLSASCPDDLFTVDGKWKEVSDYYSPSFTYKASAGSYSKHEAEAIILKVLEIAKSAYPLPKGCHANYDKHFPFASFLSPLPFGYFLRTGFFNFYCSGGSVSQIESTNVWLTIEINSFSNTRFLTLVTPPQAGPSDNDPVFNSNEDYNYLVNGRPVFYIPSQKEEREHLTYFMSDQGNVQYFLITRDSAALFIPVSRKDYLEQFKSELKDYRIYKEKTLTKWLNIAPDDESTRNFLARFGPSIEKYIQTVDRYLSQTSADELAKPVSDLLPLLPADMDNPEVIFTSFKNRQMVYFNKEYMSPKLKAHTPQFIMVELRAEKDDGSDRFRWRTAVRENFEKNLDFRELKLMLK